MAITPDSLIGTKYAPAGLANQFIRGCESLAYHENNPYPYFHFQDWRTEIRGPYPKCLPLCRTIVRKGARWLFGKPVHIDSVSEEQQERLRKAWQSNQMPARLVRLAEMGGVWGSQALWFGYDETNKIEPISIAVYNPTKEIRFYWDQFDRTKILMARMQYATYDPVRGQFIWHRQDWTDAKKVVYKDIAADKYEQIAPYQNINQPEEGKWQVESVEVNPFGIVPGWCVRNSETETEWGDGDMWTLFRIVDRVNLTYHLMDRSNQFDSEPNVVYMDTDIPPDEIDRPRAPGQPEAVNTAADAKSQGKVELLEAKGSMRPAMRDYAADLIQDILSCVGSVELDPATITNKGSLSRQVLTLMYEPLIEVTGEKRKTYGEDGICKFLERLCVGMKNLGKEPAFASVNPNKLDTYNVTLRWPDYFPLTDEEKAVRVDLTRKEQEYGYLPHTRAVERIAQMEDVEDVEKMLGEIESDPPYQMETPEDENPKKPSN